MGATSHSYNMPKKMLVSADPLAEAIRRGVHVLNGNTDRLNELMFGPMDYAVVGYRS